jgi:VanZ family protein
VSRSRFAIAFILYALLIAYASTIVGVAGPHYVAIDWDEALRRLIHMRYVDHGSDQRSDWMGNLVMAVPLGFLVAGWLLPNRPAKAGREIPIPVAAGALILCVGFIVAVKFAQLFFPPRTVTLNYVLAQSLGAVIGILLLGLIRSPLAELGHGHGRLENLRLILQIYTGLLVVFMLMPLDFALNADDVAAQLNKLPGTLTAFGDSGRPLMVRIAVILASTVATAPIGALLTLMTHGRTYVGRSTSAAAWMGFFAMFGVYALSTLLLSGSASLPAVVLRTVGIATGAWFMHWLTRQDPHRVRYELGDLVPWTVPIYLLTLFGVNGLLSLDWSGPGPIDGDYGYGMLPLFNYYIVSKSQAAKNIVGHMVMYAPLGVLIWLRAKNRGKGTAIALAVVLSALVEFGRSFRPGLAPDINAIPLAGFAAWGANALMPPLWQTLSSVAIGRAVSIPLRPSQGVPLIAATGWRDRAVQRREQRRDRATPPGRVIGDIEDY